MQSDLHSSTIQGKGKLCYLSVLCVCVIFYHLLCSFLPSISSDPILDTERPGGSFVTSVIFHLLPTRRSSFCKQGFKKSSLVCFLNVVCFSAIFLSDSDTGWHFSGDGIQLLQSPNDSLLIGIHFYLSQPCICKRKRDVIESEIGMFAQAFVHSPEEEKIATFL